MDTKASFIIIIVIIATYFLPTIAAWNREARGSVFIINLLLGWTLIGWVVALVWAINSKPEANKYNYTCSYCGFKRTLNQQVKIYVCPQCNEKTEYPQNSSSLNKETEPQIIPKTKLKENVSDFAIPIDPILKMKENLKDDEMIIKVLGNGKVGVMNHTDWAEVIELGNAHKFEIIYKKSNINVEL